ncbi:sensor histidine kinase [Shewanella sp. GXUN23E]|uniref:sensor histidine kinase n=1 Tax=Shewanella sp. GXUN23E TaxID=3422498 RepID=UPI003D7DA242
MTENPLEPDAKATLALRTRLLLVLTLCWAAASGLCLWLVSWLGDAVLLPILLLAGGLALLLSAWLTRRLEQALKAMELGLLNLIDNDFSVSLPVDSDPQLRQLALLFNQASAALRHERQHLYQRELLLDKVIQNSPNLMLLLDASGHIIYANDAARLALHSGKPITGMTLASLAADSSAKVAAMLIDRRDGLFSVEAGDDRDEFETWHLSRGRFSLNGLEHQLILLRQMTRELSRQEVAVWKKVIRVISHELNNSLAPMRSMVHSGRTLSANLDEPRLQLIFDTIDKRTAHLSDFIEGYARFARLPNPVKKPLALATLCQGLALQTPFRLVGELPVEPLLADETQLEQVLLNLLKNAHESGSPADEITLAAQFRQVQAQTPAGFVIEVADRGQGMSAEVLAQALLPFYSTKQQGTGLGLALCREIIEAHNGQIHLRNRHAGGLSVRLWLPAQESQI